MKKPLSLLLALVMAAAMLGGCAGQQAQTAPQSAPGSSAQATEKEKVVIACWGNQMLDGYAPYLRDLFP